MSYCGLAIYIKTYVKAKEEELYENSNISPCKIIVLKQSSTKKPKILQDVIITLL